MFASVRERASRYLEALRHADEDKALKRVSGSLMDLRLWRRDSGFREAERAALAAPKSRTRIINLNAPPYTSYEEAAEMVRRRLEGFGYETDPVGHVIRRDTYYEGQ
jgi:hypothetical protein